MSTMPHQEELRKLWVEFRDSLKEVYADGNWQTRATGAAEFIDFLSGIRPRKRTSSDSYLSYPHQPWPS